MKRLKKDTVLPERERVRERVNECDSKMGSNPEPEAEQEQEWRAAKLPLFSLPPLSIQSPDHSGIVSPPIFTTSLSASVPFQWEELPGKPRHISNSYTCTAITISTAAASGGGAPPKCLELPPRLLLIDSPPCNHHQAGSMRFQSSSSFRMMMSPRDCYGSAFSPEGTHLGALVLRKRGGFVREISGWFGSWRLRSLIKDKREASGGGGVGGRSVFPSTAENTPTSPTRILRRNESFSRHAKARQHFWGSMSEGLKQVVPSWTTRKKKVEREG